MAETSIGELTATLKLRDEMTAQLKSAQKEIDKLESKVGDANKSIAKSDLGGVNKLVAQASDRVKTAGASIEEAGAAGFAATELLASAGVAIGVVGLAFGKAAIAAVGFAGDLTSVRAATGLSLGLLQDLSYAGQQVGVSLGDIQSAASFLNRTLSKGSDSTIDALSVLGLKLADIMAMRPDERLMAIASALREIPDPAKRAEVQFALLGSSGEKLQPLIDDLDQLTRGVTKMSDETVVQLDRVGREWERLKALATTGAKAVAGGVLDSALQLYAAANPFSPTAAFITAPDFETNKSGRRDVSLSGPQLTDTQRLSAARQEILSLTSAQRDQINAAIKLGTSIGDVAKQYGLSADAARIYRDMMKSLNETTKTQGQLVAEALKRLKDQQAQLVIQALAFEKFAGPDALALPIAVQEKYYNALQAVIDQYGSLEAAGLGSLRVVYNQLDVNVGKVKELSDHLRELVKPLNIADLPGQLTPKQVFDILHPQLPIVSNLSAFTGTTSTLGTPVSLVAAPSKSFSESFFGLSSAELGKQVGATITQAFAGGGNAGVAAASLLGQSIGNTVVKDFGGSVTKNLGSTLGGAFASIIPGVGALLGPLVGAIGGKIKDLLKGGEGAKVNDARDAFLKAQGGADALYDKLGKIGRLDLWQPLATGPGKMKAINKAIEDIEKALEDAEDRARSINGELGDLGSALDAFGGRAPNAIKPLIQEILTLNGLTEDQRDLLNGLVTASPFDAIRGAAERLGVSFEHMGDQFKQAQISETAFQILHDLQTLEEGGADLNGVLSDSAPKLQELYDVAAETGLKLPDTLKPYYERLIELGKLVGPDGELVTNIDQLSFAEIKDDALEAIKGILEQIRDLLAKDIPDAARDAQDAIDSVDTQKLFGRGGKLIPIPGGSELTVPALAGGGYVDKPTLALIGEAGPEYVVPASQMGSGAVLNVTVNAQGSYFPDRGSMDELAIALMPSLTRAATVFVSR